jgi:hypothetical protein
VTFTRRLTESGNSQNRGHRAPRHVFPALGKQLHQQAIQAKHPPQAPSKPDVTKVSQPLELDVLEADLDVLIFISAPRTRRIEESPLGPTGRIIALQMRTKLRPAVLLTRREIAEIRDHPLP